MVRSSVCQQRSIGFHALLIVLGKQYLLPVYYLSCHFSSIKHTLCAAFPFSKCPAFTISYNLITNQSDDGSLTIIGRTFAAKASPGSDRGTRGTLSSWGMLRVAASLPSSKGSCSKCPVWEEIQHRSTAVCWLRRVLVEESNQQLVREMARRSFLMALCSVIGFLWWCVMKQVGASWYSLLYT